MLVRAKAVGDVSRHVLSSSIFAWAMVELPPLMHGATRFWLWGVFAAVLGGAAAVVQRYRRKPMPSRVWWPSALAVSIGVTVDFFALPPDIMMSMCRNTGGIDFGVEAVVAHIRLLPATSLAMLMVIGLTRRQDATHGMAWAEWGLVLPAIALEYAFMVVPMALCVEVFRAIAASADLPWTGDGMGAGMMVGMLFSPFLKRVSLLGTSRLREKWLHG